MMKKNLYKEDRKEDEEECPICKIEGKKREEVCTHKGLMEKIVILRELKERIKE